jgi:hypothetical protein
MKNTMDRTTTLSATILLTRYVRFSWRHFGSCINAGELQAISVPKHNADAASAAVTATTRHGGHRSVPRLWLLVRGLTGRANALGHAFDVRFSIGGRAISASFEPFHAVDVR